MNENTKETLGILAKKANEKVPGLAGMIEEEIKGKAYISKSESLKEGRALREKIPLEKMGEWEVRKHRRKPIRLLEEQEASRVPELVPLRHERMSVSPFTFYRGAAVIMAEDLSKTPVTGITVQAVGDAHISNFGIFASPERRLVFDINDFDETLPGPWEWDVKRLMASIEICGRDRGFSAGSRHKAVRKAAEVYRKSMLDYSEMGNLSVWYAHLDIEDWLAAHKDGIPADAVKSIKKMLKKAKTKNSEKAVAKLTETVDGRLRIISDPPLIVPLRDLNELADGESIDFLENLVLNFYRLSLPREKRNLISQYRPADAARKTVGVGSVGMKAWILVLEGEPGADPLVLQIKEASASVLEKYLPKSRFIEHGKRVVDGQKAIQTAGDILLGYCRVPRENGYDDYYVRQLWDAKGSVDLNLIDEDGLTALACLCAETLARAHAKTGNRHAIAGYLGRSKAFEKAMTAFAEAYADQNEADYNAFLKSLTESGKNQKKTVNAKVSEKK